MHSKWIKVPVAFKLILWVLSITGCREQAENQPTPSGIIPDSVMIELVAETQLIEAAVNLQLFEKKGLKPDRSHLYESYLKKKGITPEQYMKSYSYYMDNPEKMQRIYEEALTYLSRKESGFRGK